MPSLIFDNLYVLPPVLLLLCILALWHRESRMPATDLFETTVSQPPDNLGPVEIGALIDERVSSRDILAAIVDLAIRGYITVSYQYDWTLHLTKPYEEITADPKLSEFERTLISAIFLGSQSAQPARIGEGFLSRRELLLNMIYKPLINNGYFARHPQLVRNASAFLGAAIAFIGIATCAAILGEIVQFPMKWAASIALCGLIIGFAVPIVPNRTEEGKRALIAARAFRHYLLQTPIQTIGRGDEFEKYLPYALVFRAGGRWGKAFQSVENAPITWYSVDGKPFLPSSLGYELDSALDAWAYLMDHQNYRRPR